MTKSFKERLFDEFRGLPSYLVLLTELETLLQKDNALGLLYVDGRRLGKIEEKFGSKLFEQIMQKIATVLMAMRGVTIRNKDLVTVTEVQGYSYIIFLSETRKEQTGHVLSKDDVEMVCERVQNYLHSTLFFELYNYLKGLPKINVGYSFVVHNPMIRSRRTIYNLIDEAREIAKLHMSQLELKNRGRLQKIVLEEKIYTLYQPIVRLKDMSIMGYEALSRGPRNSEIEAPIILFTLAEETGLVFELDRLCRKRAIINAKGKPRGRKLFVNTLPNLIYDPDFEMSSFLKFLEANEMPIEDIVFEITERNAIEQYSHFKQAISYYTEAGITIAIDDVGAGYSSLEAIMEIKPRYVKIDASIVRGVHENQGKKAMLKALHALAKSIDADTVAEGVETAEDFDVLREFEIDYAQGYFFAKPGPPFPELNLKNLPKA
ncbi:MAG TPA: EAL domain-containing protein [Bdellovibrionota bacterium]|nr:EAL domain-containing protein [Bdellovibrionota bacterium]